MAIAYANDFAGIKTITGLEQSILLARAFAFGDAHPS
ncbi:hypothetical protein QOZ98_000024 [Planomicrobium stackebrandtii]|uniref:Uncharacterized protein n=1 Tax=Planomicrobium stackebrandtii TaxID=253160 RepID=A0ABU0GPB9_9BACL|nr:hypothetical protein [Planomicrobium stackebrandtii]